MYSNSQADQPAFIALCDAAEKLADNLPVDAAADLRARVQEARAEAVTMDDVRADELSDARADYYNAMDGLS